MQGVIYGLICKCHPQRGIRYVGQTSRDISQRMHEHRRDCKSGRRLPLYSWMRKHGPENITYEILEDVSDCLNEREIYWIAKMDTKAHGLNMTSGGDARDFPVSKQARKKASELRKGVPIHSESHKALLSQRWSGTGNPMYGRSFKWPEERKRKFSEAMSGNRRGCKLSDDQVVEIRHLTACGVSKSNLAERFSVSRDTIARIRSGRAYGWVR